MAIITIQKRFRVHWREEFLSDMSHSFEIGKNRGMAFAYLKIHSGQEKNSLTVEEIQREVRTQTLSLFRNTELLGWRLELFTSEQECFSSLSLDPKALYILPEKEKEKCENLTISYEEIRKYKYRKVGYPIIKKERVKEKESSKEKEKRFRDTVTRKRKTRKERSSLPL